MSSYRITLRNQIDPRRLRDLAGAEVIAQGNNSTVLLATPDQSALMGLLRQLHDAGVTLLQVSLNDQEGDWEHGEQTDRQDSTDNRCR